MSRADKHFEEFIDAYFETALWSSNDESTPEGGEPMDKNYGVEDFNPTVYQNLRNDARRFFDAHYDKFHGGPTGPSGASPYAMAGHDFWLNRNGHGAGFWDGDWPDPEATALDAASRSAGEIDLYVGDDNKIYAGGFETAQPARSMPATRQRPRTEGERMTDFFFGRRGTRKRRGLSGGLLGLPSWKGRRQ